jgi:hypothetical protein
MRKRLSEVLRLEFNSPELRSRDGIRIHHATVQLCWTSTCRAALSTVLI